MPFIVAVREDCHESYFKEFPTLEEARAYATSESAINPLSITIAEVVERPIVEEVPPPSPTWHDDAGDEDEVPGAGESLSDDLKDRLGDW